jgi:acetylornithine deacetylase/succinyl-diaminopimelate desuccinylase-like protein
MAPLSGEIRGDCIYGRSAIDIKGLGIPQISSFLALRDSSEKLNRNVIFRATADEEAGGHYSAGWLLENRPEIFKEAGYLVNEGGSTTLLDEIMAFNIEVTQQLPLWLRLTAADILGHGSAPRTTSSVKKFRPDARIADIHFERRAIPGVQAYFLLSRYSWMVSARQRCLISQWQ